MSIWYTLTAAVTFVVTVILWGLCVHCISVGVEDEDAGGVPVIYVWISLLAVLSLWLLFLAWLGIGLVRTAWRWGDERLGTPVFSYLQIGMIVMTVPFFLMKAGFRGGLRMLPWMLLGIEIPVAIMAINFLFLAWFARCRVPLHAYCEILTIMALCAFEIWVVI